MSRRKAFEVVDAFEGALCEFTGAPFAVAVDSCTNALFLALKWTHTPGAGLEVPRHTYVGAVQAAKNAGWDIRWIDSPWRGGYALDPSGVVDSAKQFYRGMYEPGSYECVSFQAGKLLPIGRGGAILHDDEEADAWFRKARLDGRVEGADYKNPVFQTPGYHCYMPPDAAARGLWLMTYLEDDDKGDWTEYPDLSEAEWV